MLANEFGRLGLLRFVYDGRRSPASGEGQEMGEGAEGTLSKEASLRVGEGWEFINALQGGAKRK